MKRYAVVPTHNRPAELVRLLESVEGQVDQVLVIDNASDPVFQIPAKYHHWVDMHSDPEQPPNLSRLWNNGLRWIEHLEAEVGGTEWDVAILNDDAIVPPGWFDAVGITMREQHAAAGCSCDRRAPGTMFHFGPEMKPSQDTRLTGWAFMLRGELKLRADERFRWLCGDDDLSAQARRAGGIIKVGGFPVQNTLADTSTHGELAIQGAKDMQSFVDKWGERPW